MWVRQGEGIAGDSSSHVGKTGGGEWQATRPVMWVRQGRGVVGDSSSHVGKTGGGEW